MLTRSSGRRSKRSRLAETLDARGEREAAELELAAAQATFEKIGAPALVEKCRAMRNGW